MTILGETQQDEREDLRDELFENARRTGEYLDGFTYNPTLDNVLGRLPKCLIRINGKIQLREEYGS